MTDPFAAIRTVCHGCRTQSHVAEEDDNGVTRLRNLVIPGDGSVWKEKAPGGMVQEPCPVCGDSDDPGWLPGFVIPV